MKFKCLMLSSEIWNETVIQISLNIHCESFSSHNITAPEIWLHKPLVAETDFLSFDPQKGQVRIRRSQARAFDFYFQTKSRFEIRKSPHPANYNLFLQPLVTVTATTNKQYYTIFSWGKLALLMCELCFQVRLWIR